MSTLLEVTEELLELNDASDMQTELQLEMAAQLENQTAILIELRDKFIDTIESGFGDLVGETRRQEKLRSREKAGDFDTEDTQGTKKRTLLSVGKDAFNKEKEKEGAGFLEGIFDMAASVGGFLAMMSTTFAVISSTLAPVMAVLGSITLPVIAAAAAIYALYEGITGAFEAFENETGDLADKLIAGLGGLVKGLMKVVTVPLDLLKDAIAWVAGAFGFEEFEEMLDSFSFTELFSDLVDSVVDLLQGLKDWIKGKVTGLWSWITGEDEDEPPKRSVREQRRGMRGSQSKDMSRPNETPQERRLQKEREALTFVAEQMGMDPNDVSGVSRMGAIVEINGQAVPEELQKQSREIIYGSPGDNDAAVDKAFAKLESPSNATEATTGIEPSDPPTPVEKKTKKTSKPASQEVDVNLRNLTNEQRQTFNERIKTLEKEYKTIARQEENIADENNAYGRARLKTIEEIAQGKLFPATEMAEQGVIAGPGVAKVLEAESRAETAKGLVDNYDPGDISAVEVAPTKERGATPSQAASGIMRVAPGTPALSVQGEAVKSPTPVPVVQPGLDQVAKSEELSNSTNIMNDNKAQSQVAAPMINAPSNTVNNSSVNTTQVAPAMPVSTDMSDRSHLNGVKSRY